MSKRLRLLQEVASTLFEVDIYFPNVDLDNWNRSEIEALEKISRDAEN